MKSQKENSILLPTIFMVLSLGFCISCIHAQETDTIKINELTVLLPAEDWEANSEVNNKWTAGFYKNKSSFFAVSGITYLTVFKDSLKKQMVGLDEYVIADSIFNHEIEAFENTYGYYDIKYSIYKKDRGVKYFAGKKFFILEFESETNTYPKEKGREILYWYFPDDFIHRHVSYGFQLLEYWYNDKIDNDEIETLYFVLKNIKVDDSLRIHPSYSQVKNSYYNSKEVSFGVGFATGIEKHVFNAPYDDEAVNSALGLNLNNCYFFNNSMGIGFRFIGYYKKLHELTLTDPHGNQTKVKYDLVNLAVDGEFKWIFNQGKIEPYGFLLMGLSAGSIIDGDDELYFSGLNAGIGAGLRIPIDRDWGISVEIFGILGTAEWDEKPFLNSRGVDFNPSTVGILLNLSHMFGLEKN